MFIDTDELELVAVPSDVTDDELYCALSDGSSVEEDRVEEVYKSLTFHKLSQVEEDNYGGVLIYTERKTDAEDVRL